MGKVWDRVKELTGGGTGAVVGKEINLTDLSDQISNQWYETMRTPQPSYSSYVRQVIATDATSGYVVVSDEDGYLKVPWSLESTDDGSEIGFDLDQATRVEQQWVEKDLPAMPISKTDSKRQIVSGWANVALLKSGEPPEDSQGDAVDPETLEDSAYAHTLLFREADEVHTEKVVGHLVGSVYMGDDVYKAWAHDPVTGEYSEAAHKAMADNLPQSAWWVSYYIPDPEIFAKCEPGADGAAPEYQMFSIGGAGVRTPLPEEVTSGAA